MTSLSILQFAPQLRNIDENVQFILTQIKDLEDSLFLLPEFFLTGYFEYDFIAASGITKLLRPLCEKSKQKNIEFFGSLPVTENNKRYNRGVFISQGKIYFQDKIELFGDEKQHFQQGEKQTVHDYTDVSLQICMDINNPLHSWRAVHDNNAQLIVNPATASLPFLHTINKARAMENQVPAVFINRCGEENNIKYMGKSAIFYPDGGEIILDTEEELRIIRPNDRPRFQCSA